MLRFVTFAPTKKYETSIKSITPSMKRVGKLLLIGSLVIASSSCVVIVPHDNGHHGKPNKVVKVIKHDNGKHKGNRK